MKRHVFLLRVESSSFIVQKQLRIFTCDCQIVFSQSVCPAYLWYHLSMQKKRTLDRSRVFTLVSKEHQCLCSENFEFEVLPKKNFWFEKKLCLKGKPNIELLWGLFYRALLEKCLPVKKNDF